MKKLKLNLDEIKVESFEVKETSVKQKGTVLGQLEPKNTDLLECGPGNTFAPLFSCYNTGCATPTCEMDCR